jgi:hypothetical protein
MISEASYRPAVHPVVAALEVAVALAALLLIAVGTYGLYARFQPNLDHFAAMRGEVALTWLPIGAFILTDVMLFRRNIAKTFMSRSVLVIAALWAATFVGAQAFWVAGLPALRSLDATGPAHVYSYTILAKAPRYGALLCPGEITLSTRIWFRKKVCAPEDIWRDARVGAGLTLSGVWTPAGLRYDAMTLKK